MKSTTIITVDDVALIREGIRSLAEKTPNVDLVGEGEAGSEVIPLVQRYKPDILFLDLDMPEIKGEKGRKFQVVSTIRVVKRIHPEISIVILSNYASHTMLEATISRGVSAYLLKSDPFSVSLPFAISAAKADGVYFSNGLREMISFDEDELLTKRQKQFIMLILEFPEATPDELGEAVGITGGSFKNALLRIYKKLGVSNKASCILECLKRGIISIPN